MTEQCRSAKHELVLYMLMFVSLSIVQLILPIGFFDEIDLFDQQTEIIDQTESMSNRSILIVYIDVYPIYYIHSIKRIYSTNMYVEHMHLIKQIDRHIQSNKLDWMILFHRIDGNENSTFYLHYAVVRLMVCVSNCIMLP